MELGDAHNDGAVAAAQQPSNLRERAELRVVDPLQLHDGEVLAE